MFKPIFPEYRFSWSSKDIMLPFDRLHIGPFASETVRDKYEQSCIRLYAQGYRLHQVQDVWTGEIVGDRVVWLDEVGAEHDLPSLSDTVDWDHLILLCNGQKLRIPRRMAVLILNTAPGDADLDRLETIQTNLHSPYSAYLAKGMRFWELDDQSTLVAEPITSIRHHEAGVVVLAEVKTPGYATYAVCWREDGRRRKADIISLHDDLDLAHAAHQAAASSYDLGLAIQFIKSHKHAPDSQRQRVYNMEAALTKAHEALLTKLTLDECRFLVTRVWDLYGNGRPMPDVLHKPSLKKTSYYRRADHRICLASWGLRVKTVLHEAAHAVLDSRSAKLAAHGPEFVGVLFRIYQEFAGVDMNTMLALADQHKVKVDFSLVPLSRAA